MPTLPSQPKLERVRTIYEDIGSASRTKAKSFSARLLGINPPSAGSIVFSWRICIFARERGPEKYGSFPARPVPPDLIFVALPLGPLDSHFRPADARNYR